MGSSPSSPVRDVTEKFWVPPAVIERKRAQSLVPALSHHDSDDDPSSGPVTPGSLTGLREMTFTFSNERVGIVTGSDGLPPLPSHRPRRASMQDAIDLRKIDTKLYDRKHTLQRQHSLPLSREEENLGSVNFSLTYNKETHLLTVSIIQAADLTPRDLCGNLDPYCKVSLLPSHRSQLQTKVHKKTVNPKFDEEFIFDVSPHKLPFCSLEILLLDYDQFSRHESIGQVKLLLDCVDLQEPAVLWKGISPVEKSKSKDQKDYGDLMFSMTFLSSAERLTVVVTKARNLHHLEEGKLLDAYVKVSILHKGKRVKKKKTSVIHQSQNPTWNEALVFSVSRETLRHLSMEMIVCHENKLGNDNLIGRIRIGNDSEGDERVHWNDLISCKSATARWHPLSPL
ncbi:synaptotagmin-1-like isoform X1 [Argopecten irradians]|uniref:synaptotagmin-1-like isoform X1 n=2 Tax=Argopecten irradians TaxID=31199 RepID=UPI0037147204